MPSTRHVGQSRFHRPDLTRSRGSPPAAAVNRAPGLRPFALAPFRWVLFSSRLSCSSHLLILGANEQNVSSWFKCYLFSGRRLWRGRPSGDWHLGAGVSRDSSVPSVHRRPLFTSFATPGSRRGRVARSPLGEASEPRRSGTGVPPAQGLLSAPSNALHMELLSPRRPSVPVTALFCRTVVGTAAPACGRPPVSPTSYRSRSRPLGSRPWVGFSWEVFSSPAWSLCRLTPSPPGTRENPDLSLINTCEMIIPKLQRVFYFIIHFAY